MRTQGWLPYILWNLCENSSVDIRYLENTQVTRRIGVSEKVTTGMLGAPVERSVLTL